MGWLIQMLIDAVREQCSQFIVDMMEIVNQVFTELLSCNLDLFEELFSVVKEDVYKRQLLDSDENRVSDSNILDIMYKTV